MKRIFKTIGYLVALIIIAVASLLTYVKAALPKVKPAPDMKVNATPEMVKRGQYLATRVCLCVDCHSERDFSKYGGPLVESTTGQGGEIFDQRYGFPGKIVPKNITPYKLADWTDGEIYRTITTGVSKDGHALFPLMPYQNYGKMDPYDIKCIVAYIRTLPSVKKENIETELDFPLNFIVNTIPEEAQPQTIPDKKDELKYGEYMTNAANCAGCHTKEEKGKKVGEPFAGGFEFNMPDGSVIRSANITPDNETGIGMLTREMFIQKFRAFADSNYHAPTVKPGQVNTLMPWDMYGRMDTTDLGAIYSYLRTVKAVKGTIVHYTAPVAKS